MVKKRAERLHQQTAVWCSYGTIGIEVSIFVERSYVPFTVSCDFTGFLEVHKGITVDQWRGFLWKVCLQTVSAKSFRSVFNVHSSSL